MTGISSSCGACKFLRRRCARDCVFAPHFNYEESATHFAAIHKVFGASNVSKMLMNLPAESRSEAAITISYEAFARMHNPVYGCVAHIFALQNQVASLKEEIEMMETQMVAATHKSTMGNNKTFYNMEHLATCENDIILHNLINQGSSFLYQTGNSFELMAQLPHVNGRDQFISQINGDPDPFRNQISETGQIVDLQNPWNIEVDFN